MPESTNPDWLKNQSDEEGQEKLITPGSTHNAKMFYWFCKISIMCAYIYACKISAHSNLLDTLSYFRSALRTYGCDSEHWFIQNRIQS